MSIMRRRSIEASLAASEEPERHLRRTLGPWNIVLMGIGVVVGAGIFSKAADVSSTLAGPSVIISFLIAAVVCGLAALCYAEFASHIPVAGSAYTFSYSSMGELIAWIVGWDLILEMGLAAAMVAEYWGIYLNKLFILLGWQGTDAAGNATGLHNSFTIAQGHSIAPFNLLFIAILAVLLILGTKLSANVTGVLTVIKIVIALIIIVAGFMFMKASNFHPFIPASVSQHSGFSVKNTLFSTMLGGNSSAFGVMGILAGAGAVFFAFIGFDIVATAAEETREPKKNVPRGIVGALAAVSALYILMSIALSGMAKPAQLAIQACNNLKGQIGVAINSKVANVFGINDLIKNHVISSASDPKIGTLTCYTAISSGKPVNQGSAGSNSTITDAFTVAGHSSVWLQDIVTIGILIGLTTVVMVVFLGCVRIVFAMSRDGLFPRGLSRTSKRFGTPVAITIILFVLIGVSSSVLNVGVLGDMINIGTLSAFVLVSFGVPILRRRRKHAPHDVGGYTMPWSPTLPIISGVVCLWLSFQLPVETWIRFIVWLAIGLVIYFGYGYRHSRLHSHPEDIAIDYTHAFEGAVVPGVQVGPGINEEQAHEPAEPRGDE